ncbi:MAG: DUF1553 domain-containing protein [Verrucomicrobiota bacterium]
MKPVFVSVTLVLSGIAGAAELSSEQITFFENKVRPLLLEHCAECHSQSEKIKGGLRLDSREGWMKGGDSGPAIAPGSPDESLLIKAVSYAEPDLEMPPTQQLPAEKIAILREWIEMGAPDPRTGVAEVAEKSQQIAAEDLWSFQQLQSVAPPEMEDDEWNGDAIDRFVRAKLDEAGLPPAPIADKAVLIRRTYLDLIGLPPTPEQLDVALNQTHAELVDELLASPGFGDRWARHWLDLTAYADTIGVGRAIPALEAWRYRDYVIAAFNDDKPFDEFIRQQLSGDIKIPPAPGVPEGPDPTAEGIIATGFLAIGPWELVGGDKAQLQMDVVDRQVNRIGKAFLGMTLECARCHDHKFDPVSQHDYFAMAGILRSTVTLEGRINGVFSNIVHTELPETSQQLLARAERVRAFEAVLSDQVEKRKLAQTKAAELKKQIGNLEKEIAAVGTNEDATPKQEELDKLKKQQKATDAQVKKIADRIGVLKFVDRSRTRSMAMSVRDTWEPFDCAVNIRGNAHQLGEIVPRGFLSEVQPKNKPAFTRGGSGRVQLADWIAHEQNTLTARVWVNRVWHHLFGAGLVRTVDNFGKMGEAPSHPELLDHLAAQFMAEGWSTKKLVRKIVLSRTWRQAATNSSAIASNAENLDPDNRLIWRANRRRMEAEAIRDSMLVVSGELDSTRGGPSIPFDVPGNLNPSGTGSLPAGLKLPDDFKLRRTIYLPVKRKKPFDAVDFITPFDLPDTNQETGRRTVTAVPTQALYLANSAFVKERGAALSRRFADQPKLQRIESIYLAAYSRKPAAAETEEALAFVAELKAELKDEAQAWARFGQSILMTNEFLFRN